MTPDLWTIGETGPHCSRCFADWIEPHTCAPADVQKADAERAANTRRVPYQAGEGE